MDDYQYGYCVEYEQMQGCRSNQEDAVNSSCGGELYYRKGILMVLSDGMGGMSDGEKFSEIAARVMVDHFEKIDPMEDMTKELLNCFGEAQQEALKLTREGINGGATVVAILIRDHRCTFLSVGDSSLCLLRRGGLIHLNRKQTLGLTLDESVALGYLGEEYAAKGVRKHALTSHLGSEDVTCDVCSVPFIVHPGDRIALMSDGVTGQLSDEELAEAIGTGTCRQAVECVISKVRAKGNPRQDNASIILVGMEENWKQQSPEQTAQNGSKPKKEVKRAYESARA